MTRSIDGSQQQGIYLQHPLIGILLSLIAIVGRHESAHMKRRSAARTREWCKFNLDIQFTLFIVRGRLGLPWTIPVKS